MILLGQASRRRRSRESLEDLDESLLPEVSRATWKKEEANLRVAIDRMTGRPGIDTLRAGFALLSEEMPVILDRLQFGLRRNQVYLMHCPMAFDGRGAAWLQAGQEPRNPYFGATMLRCVDKVEKFSSGNSSPTTSQEHQHD